VSCLPKQFDCQLQMFETGTVMSVKKADSRFHQELEQRADSNGLCKISTTNFCSL